MRVSPMRLRRNPELLDHPDFLFEPKIDGFCALAHVRGQRCELVPRNAHVFKSWPALAADVAQPSARLGVERKQDAWRQLSV